MGLMKSATLGPGHRHCPRRHSPTLLRLPAAAPPSGVAVPPSAVPSQPSAVTASSSDAAASPSAADASSSAAAGFRGAIARTRPRVCDDVASRASRCEERDEDDASSSSADDTTWGEVCTSCWIHPPAEWPRIGAYGLGILFFLYWFVFSLELLGAGAKVLTGCAAAGLFGVDTNPVATLVVGILATVGTTVTNTIVVMVQMGDGDELLRAFTGASRRRRRTMGPSPAREDGPPRSVCPMPRGTGCRGGRAGRAL